jgi:hypothetical protein
MEDFEMRIIVDVNAMAITKVKRSWKERLLSVPWKPLKKENEIHTPGCYQIGEDILFVHPVVWEEIKKEIESQKWSVRIPYGMNMFNSYNPIIGVGSFF